MASPLVANGSLLGMALTRMPPWAMKSVPRMASSMGSKRDVLAQLIGHDDEHAAEGDEGT